MYNYEFPILLFKRQDLRMIFYRKTVVEYGF